MPALIERPKMSLAMWAALKSHIMKQREKKKQEQEADAAIERVRREQEMKRKQDAMTLEEIKEQLGRMDGKLTELKDEKHLLFMQLKKVLNEDETRRKAQVKETNEFLAVSHGYPPSGMSLGAPPPLYLTAPNTHLLNRSSNMYKVGIAHHQTLLPAKPNVVVQITNLIITAVLSSFTAAHSRIITSLRKTGVRDAGPSFFDKKLQKLTFKGSLKRQRSPSPPPLSQSGFHQNYNYKTHISTAFSQKQGVYTSSQSSSFYPHQATSSVSLGSSAGNSPSMGTGISSGASGGSVVTVSAGASATYPTFTSQYAAEQVPNAKHVAHPAYHLPHIQQQSFVNSLQQQLEQANQKAGFSEEKYYVQQSSVVPIRGVAPIPTGQTLIPIQQSTKTSGGITSGFPLRMQPPTPTSHFQQSAGSTAVPHNSFPSQGTVPRLSFQGPPTTRYY